MKPDGFIEIEGNEEGVDLLIVTRTGVAKSELVNFNRPPSHRIDKLFFEELKNLPPLEGS